MTDEEKKKQEEQTAGAIGCLIVIIVALIILFCFGMNIVYIIYKIFGVKLDNGQLWTLSIIISVATYFGIYYMIRDFKLSLKYYVIGNLVILALMLISHYLFKFPYLTSFIKVFFPDSTSVAN